MELVWVWIICGGLAFFITLGKERGFFTACFLSWMGPVGMVASFVMKENQKKVHASEMSEMKHIKCPECLGLIPEVAKKCQHCGSDVK